MPPACPYHIRQYHSSQILEMGRTTVGKKTLWRHYQHPWKKVPYRLTRSLDRKRDMGFLSSVIHSWPYYLQSTISRYHDECGSLYGLTLSSCTANTPRIQRRSSRIWTWQRISSSKHQNLRIWLYQYNCMPLSCRSL